MTTDSPKVQVGAPATTARLSDERVRQILDRFYGPHEAAGLETRALCQEVLEHRARATREGEAFRELAKEQAATLRLRASLSLVATEVEDVWRWQGDGADHPGSLCCPVVMSAETLRALVSRAADPTAGIEQHLWEECALWERRAKAAADALGMSAKERLGDITEASDGWDMGPKIEFLRRQIDEISALKVERDMWRERAQTPEIVSFTMPIDEPEERTAARLEDVRSLEGATLTIGEQQARVSRVDKSRWPTAVLRLVALALTLLVLGACSTPDPGDMAALDTEIAKQPDATKDKLKVGVVTTRLRDHRPSTQVIEVYCREAGGPMAPAGPWEGMYELKGLVLDILVCMFTGSRYEQCGNETGQILIDIAQQGFAKVGKTMECKWQWLPKFDPSKVTIDDTGSWLIGLPAPPPELLPEELAPLVPFLCPLTVWGCPPRPGDIGTGNGASSTGDFQ